MENRLIFLYLLLLRWDDGDYENLKINEWTQYRLITSLLLDH
jgi:hypothetical protein